MEYAAMLAGLCLKEEGGKWSRRLVRAGGSEQLYSGVTIRKPSLSWKMTVRVIMRSDNSESDNEECCQPV